LDAKRLCKFCIEKRDDCHTFLISPKAEQGWLEWFGIERSKAFSQLSPHASKHSDLDGRDPFYWHMLLWDPQKNSLIGGQRFQFINETNKPGPDESYLEYCYPGLAEQMLAASKCYVEVGRTFLMPPYQGKSWLKELIRGFVRIPEQQDFKYLLGMVSFNHLALNQLVIDYFLAALNTCQFRGSLPISKPRHAYPTGNPTKALAWNQIDLPSLTAMLKEIDQSFEMPLVLGPYRFLCSVKYEGVSIASSYNQILQLLFSGRTDLLTTRQKSWLPPYPSFQGALGGSA